MRVSVIVTAVCLVLGIPMAWRLARSESRWKSAYVMAIVLPLFIGATTRTAGWMILFAHGGMLDIAGRGFSARDLDLMNTELAVIIGIVSINLPFTVLTLQSVFEGIDPRLEEAARAWARAGARVPARRLAAGDARRADRGGAVLHPGMNAYATPLLLGGPRFQMMAPLLYWEFATNNNWPFAAALAFILMASTLVLTVAGQPPDTAPLSRLGCYCASCLCNCSATSAMSPARRRAEVPPRSDRGRSRAPAATSR